MMDLSHLESAGMGGSASLSASTPVTRPAKSGREYAMSPRKTPRAPEAMTAKQRADLETEGVLRKCRTTMDGVESESLRGGLETLIRIGEDFLAMDTSGIHQEQLNGFITELQGLSISACRGAEWKQVKPLMSRLLWALSRCARLLDVENAERARQESSLSSPDQLSSTMSDMSQQLSGIIQQPKRTMSDLTSSLESIPEQPEESTASPPACIQTAVMSSQTRSPHDF